MSSSSTMIVLSSGIIVQVLEEERDYIASTHKYLNVTDLAYEEIEIKYELKVSSSLSWEEAKEWLGVVTPAGVRMTLTSLTEAEGRATVIATSQNIQNLSFKGNKYFFAKEYGGYNQTNAVIIVEDHGDIVTCLFADGKRRLIPKDVLDLNLTV